MFFSAATVVLFVVSRGKWSDAVVDSGREWIVPDALSRGALLYRDVVYWFGPVTPCFNAVFFRVFGSSFRTLALAGAVGGAGVLAALYFALGTVTDRRNAAGWMIVAIPLLVFMPFAGGIIIGMGIRMWHAAAFGLLAIGLIARPRAPLHELAAGAAVGLAGLCRTEWGAAALAGCFAALVLRSSKPGFLAAARVVAGAALIFLAGIGVFVLRAGPRAVLRDAPVLLYNLPPETRAALSAGRLEWGRGLAQMGYAAFTWVAAFLVIEALALRGQQPLTRRLPAVALCMLGTAVSAIVAGPPADIFLCAAPLLCLVSALVSLKLERGSTSAALAGFGVLGVLTSYRRVLFIADAPYVGPPILFALVCAAGCLSVAVSRRPEEFRLRLSAAVLSGVTSLAAVLFALRVFAYATDDRIPIRGTGGMLSARGETARQIEAVADRVRRETARGGSLAVFPEGEILNFLSGRSNPIRHKLYLPGYVSAANEAEILSELVRARPAAVVIWPRQLAEYGGRQFGVDYARTISAWIAHEYVLQGVGRKGPVVGIRKRDLVP